MLKQQKLASTLGIIDERLKRVRRIQSSLFYPSHIALSNRSRTICWLLF